MQWNSLLKLTGFKRGKLGKYLDPITTRYIKRETALERGAKKLGFKSYQNAKEGFKSAAYKRMKRFAAEANIETGEKFQRLFAAAWNEKRSKKNKPLAQLLKYVGKISKYRSVYAGAL